MKREEQIRLLSSDLRQWNAWRESNPREKPFLNKANLASFDLRDANLVGSSLRDADLRGANLSGVDLSGADLSFSYLQGTNLTGAILDGSYLKAAKFDGGTKVLEKWISIRDLLTIGGKNANLSKRQDLKGINIQNSFFPGADFSFSCLQRERKSDVFGKGDDIGGLLIN